MGWGWDAKKGIKNETKGKQEHKKNRTCERADFTGGQQEELRRDDNRRKITLMCFFFALPYPVVIKNVCVG